MSTELEKARENLRQARDALENPMYQHMRTHIKRVIRICEEKVAELDVKPSFTGPEFYRANAVCNQCGHRGEVSVPIRVLGPKDTAEIRLQGLLVRLKEHGPESALELLLEIEDE